MKPNSNLSAILFSLFVALNGVCFLARAQESVPPAVNSSDPGLKVVRKGEAFAIYLDAPWTVGADGFIGGMEQRKVRLILEHGYNLSKEIQAAFLHSETRQLYAFDDSTVFTSDGGGWGGRNNKEWRFFPRVTCLYSLTNEHFCVTNDVYALARTRYGLASNEVFMGMVGANIFYWKTEDPRKVFYRESSASAPAGSLKLPRRVIEIRGVAKGLKKDVIITVFQNTPGFFHWYPREFGAIEQTIKPKPN